ncbi:MAG: FAD-dependent monooxygenase [Myxococcales bacterium]|nr:FAD-dependent monooxygenase [Myxococcales bacterium]
MVDPASAPSSRSLESHYDVVIVGGRPAGASLAACLGAHRIPTLVIDRARFPSGPAVPSCAFIMPHTMALLDELGIPEDALGEPGERARRVIVEFEGYFATTFRLPELGGRDYFYGIDRDRFDHAFWRNLGRYPSVTACEQTSFLDVSRDASGEVSGVLLRAPDGSIREIGARCVVGADGRFSPVARKVGAKVRESFDLTSTIHFAVWEGVAPHDDHGDVTMCVYTLARGAQTLFIPAPRGRMRVCTHVRSDRAHTEGTVEDYYLRTIRSLPTAGRRIEGATRTSEIIGVKRVANRYREPGGARWVLAGDALYHKDPLDGQGIYDALLGTKILGEELSSWHAGDQSFERAVARYEHRVLEQTHPVYEVITKRLERELYGEPPSIVLNTMMRWMMNDPTYKQRFLGYLTRTAPAQGWMKPSVMGVAMVRGLLGDLRRLVPPWGRASP